MVAPTAVVAPVGATPLTLPAAAPAPVLEPEPLGLTARACVRCEVTWYGAAGHECWCCGECGCNGPLRLFVTL